MKATTIRLPDQLRDRLKGEAKRSGLKPSEIVRRAVDEHLDKRETKSKNGKKAS